MKVFLSHQRADSALALAFAIAGRLRINHGIPSYLDVIDPDASSAGDALGEHVRTELGRCTQLLAVVSGATRTSWWVPWEIGLATEKDYPLATFAGGGTTVPEYLRRWPYLRSDADLDQYAAASKTAERSLTEKRSYENEVLARRGATTEFYRSLRASLRQ